MARLPRLTLAGQAHWIILRGHSGNAVFADDVDRQTFVAALREAAATEQVRVHAVSLQDAEVHLLVTPSNAAALSRMMQALGRRYVSAHHRRHGGSGTLWEGRFRSAVVEPGATLLDVLCLIDAQAAHGGAGQPRSGDPAPTMLVDPPEYWVLGNTPFERQAAWRRRLAEGQRQDRSTALRQIALGGWAVGSPGFVAQVGEQADRPAAPRRRGRPRTKIG